MYIPHIFLGTQGGCVTPNISGSLPSNVDIGTVTSGSETYFYIKQEVGTPLQFTVDTGITSVAKLLVVGGGGYTFAYDVNGSDPNDSRTGGGGAGQVIWQDYSLQPGITYLMSASLGGRNDGIGLGQTSIMYGNYDPLEVDVFSTIEAVGGDSNNQDTGGDSGDGFNGGVGAGGQAAGGGGGSTSDGMDGFRVEGNIYKGGDGGDGFTIPAPFNSVIGYDKVAGGGPGAEYSGNNGSYASGVSPDAYGNGAPGWQGGENNGNDGVVALFIPIANCPTSSEEDFYAEGGQIVGTFYSGSNQWKYHAFTNTGTNLFDVIRGYTTEAKVLLVAGGAGASVEADTGNWGGPTTIGGGAGAGGLEIHEDVTLIGYNNEVLVGAGGSYKKNGVESRYRSNYIINPFAGSVSGGGTGAYHTPITKAKTGGSGGGGGGIYEINGPYAYFQEGASPITGEGNQGGDGPYAARPNIQVGGGGGGAGGAGQSFTTVFSNGGLSGGPGFDLAGTFWSFLTGSVFTADTQIAKGGGGGVGTYSSGSPVFNNAQSYDGSGADPIVGGSGQSGIVVIAYPISGSSTPEIYRTYNVYTGNDSGSSCDNTNLSNVYTTSSISTLEIGTTVYYDDTLLSPLTQSYFSDTEVGLNKKWYFISGSDGVITTTGSCAVTGSTITTGSIVNVTDINTGSFYKTNFTSSSLNNIQSTGVTLEIWAKNPSLTQNYDAFIGIWDGQSSPNRDWIEIREVSGGNVYGEIYDEGSVSPSTNPKSGVADVNNFYHHVLTHDTASGDLLYYRNGQLEGSASGELEGGATYNRVYVGEQNDLQDCQMYVGEYRIYTSSLVDIDVLTNFTVTKGRYGY